MEVIQQLLQQHNLRAKIKTEQDRIVNICFQKHHPHHAVAVEQHVALRFASCVTANTDSLKKEQQKLMHELMYAKLKYDYCLKQTTPPVELCKPQLTDDCQILVKGFEQRAKLL